MHKFLFIETPLHMARNSISAIHHIKITNLHKKVKLLSKIHQEAIEQFTINTHTLLLLFFFKSFAVQIVPALLKRLAAKLYIQGQGVHRMSCVLFEDPQL